MSLDQATALQPDAALEKLKAVVRTDQEWCHLFGHGDGGVEVEDNFVAGSKHCNTEQLALELAQRNYRTEKICAKISAYLMPAKPSVDVRIDGLLKSLKAAGIAGDGPKLEGDLKAAVKAAEAAAKYNLNDVVSGKTKPVYDCMLGFFKGLKPPPGNAKLTFPNGSETLLSKPEEAARAATEFLWDTYPIAYMMRYKVYVPGTDKAMIKVIDHLYSGQREEMDYNEFQALYWFFRLRIAKALDDRDNGSRLGNVLNELRAK
jgi:hypothetical protein